MTEKIEITFVTSSPFKREENAAFWAECTLGDGRPVRDLFTFKIVDNTITETLEVSLTDIVSAEVKAAYQLLKRPCIVEHAGIIFDDYSDTGYPGGLTKPMWNTLGDRFIEETRSAGREAAAVAAIAYCDGMKVHTFHGSTAGTLSSAVRGDRAFYWDTVFVPAEMNDEGHTYAEIVATKGLSYKMRNLSQSSKALIAFLEWRLEHEPTLWKDSY